MVHVAYDSRHFDPARLHVYACECACFMYPIAVVSTSPKSIRVNARFSRTRISDVFNRKCRQKKLDIPVVFGSHKNRIFRFYRKHARAHAISR